MKLKGIYFLIVALVIILGINFAFAAQEKSDLPAKARRSFNRGLEYVKQEKWDLAIKSFEETLDKAPRDPRCLLNLALANDKAGKELMALLWYHTYLKALPDADNYQQVKTREDELLSSMYANLKKIYQAMEQILVRVDEYFVKGDPRDLPNVWEDEKEAEQSRKRALESAERTKFSLYTCMVAMAAAIGDYAKSESFCNKLPSFTLVSQEEHRKELQRIFYTVTIHQARRGDMRQAFVTAEKTTDPETKAFCYLEIAKKYANKKNAARTWEFLEKAEKTFQQSNGECHDQYYQERVKALLAIDDIAAAEKSYDSIQDAELWRPDTLKMINKAKNKTPTDEIDGWVYIAQRAKKVEYCVDLSKHLTLLKGQEPQYAIYDLVKIIDGTVEVLQDVADKPADG